VKNLELFECERLKARLTPLGCLQNRLKAVISEAAEWGAPGFLKPCLTCPIGRKIRAYLPKEDQE
jgi:hypothetical protein